MATKISGSDFNRIANTEEPVLIDFYADWCGPCRMQAPIVDELAKEGAQVYKVNVDEEMELAQRFGIMSIPTLVVLKGGQVVSKKEGLQNKDAIRSMLAI